MFEVPESCSLETALNCGPPYVTMVFGIPHSKICFKCSTVVEVLRLLSFCVTGNHCSSLQLVGDVLCLAQIGLCPVSPRHVMALQFVAVFLLVETWNFLDRLCMFL